MRKPRLLAALLLLFASSVGAIRSYAELIPFPLSEFVSRSTLIIVGEVIKLEKTVESPFFARGSNIYRATIAVGQVIKGQPNGNIVTVDYYLHPEQPQFRMEKVLAFLFPRHNRLEIFQGWYGLIPIKKDPQKPGRRFVAPIHILEQEKYQELRVFLKQIESELSK